MKTLITLLIALSLATPVLAVQTTQTENPDGTAKITISFTADEWQMFSYDKDAKEWIKNACGVNLNNTVRYEQIDTTPATPPTAATKKIKILDDIKKYKARKKLEIQ